MHYRVFWQGKSGCSEEYEDGTAAEPATGRFAVADGASESSFAALWARLLVEGFVREAACLPTDWLTWLPPLQQRWSEEIGDRPRPWNVEAKIQVGAYATFLGLVVSGADGEDERHWQAIAIGDSCLFHRRAGQLRRAFPIERSADFHNRPALVGVRSSPAALLEPNQLQTRKGRWQAGDQFWLMTDALAQWYLRQSEEGNLPGEAIDALLENPAEDGFREWVEGLWAREILRVDDVTLLAVQL